MIRVRGINVSYKLDTEDELLKKVCKKLNIKRKDIDFYVINKKSLDARKKDNIHYVYEVDLTLDNEDEIIKSNIKDVFVKPNEDYVFNITGTRVLDHRPVVVGSGPAGLFAAYMLAEYGYRPVVVERGEKMEDRIETVNKFWETGRVNVHSNVQFGEGGAGTFSDGKLNTLVKDKNFRMKKAFEIFVLNGAPEEILYLNKPHIGTDILSEVVVNMRNRIIEKGGEFRYNSLVTNIMLSSDRIEGVIINNDSKILCDVLVLAIGHSARDTFHMLYDRHIEMKPKPFAIGVRVQHPQEMINMAQYGTNEITADYKFTYNSNGRGVYTFCMCPGGYVVNASSEERRLAVNGMSYHDRDSGNANSAVIVTIGPDDFGHNPFDGVRFQRIIEQKAYNACRGKIPVQLFKDFMNDEISTGFGSIEPKFKGNYGFANLNKVLPKYVSASLKEGLLAFDKKIPGFAGDDVIIAGIESRTSSPVRILRDESCVSNIMGVYPCGEGAGYAGGITTSAMDGIKVAEAIAAIYKP